MNGEIIATKPKAFSSSGTQWIEVLQTHDELTIIFPGPGEPVKVAHKDAAKTIIRHWVREVGHHDASRVQVMWPKSHQKIWATDI